MTSGVSYWRAMTSSLAHLLRTRPIVRFSFVFATPPGWLGISPVRKTSQSINVLYLAVL